MNKLLTFPDSFGMALSIRAKALLFHDPRSSALLEQVERIARSDATVLVIGETGTGKELIARHIHSQSERKGPFIAVNCGAFSESLIDAELFGHETGAFTGATQARSGWFEAANGGTLFLDEIGDLSMALQVKLLRVLQERQVVRLGSRRPIPLDVRLVAATNVDLHKAVAAERFRSDLFYRLSVATVNLPPLCERPGDILPLARHFIGLYSAKLKLENVDLGPDAEAALLAYEWPGNIRELENVIHYALIVCRDGSIRSEDLRMVGTLHRSRPASVPSQYSQPLQLPPEQQQRHLHAVPASRAEEVQPAPALRQRLESLFNEFIEAGEPVLFDTVEEALIRTAYAWCHQNQVQTAKVLGISRNILRTHLKRFGLIGGTDGGAESSTPAESGQFRHISIAL
ncbi:sigma-54 interaction domain-containing protein [Noviherbaspirillum malthae]|uniref:sigma-54 interaction domain-containing protein n=1 Tax=Noviherbaspirillum malthae TaxID=1260987 RepID=UPI002B27955B|nr:sigma-54 dependent transcriptional regulator [Noviherbaspirillum malthae]